MKNVNAYTGPQRFAHRGLVQAAPENTLGAFQGAVDGGYEGIEIDVQMTRDGEIVIAHDSNFTRMTLGHPDGGSNRRIRDLTWDEIQKIELPYANHLLSEVPPEHSEIQLLATLPKLVMGQVEGRDYETALAEDGRMAHLMRFSDFDAWLTAQSRSITVEVEVKAPGLAGPILELLSRSPNTGSYILFSGDPVYVEEMQAAVRKNGKPTGLRMGANMRRLTEEAKRMIPNMDLFEVGLNADAFTCEDVRWLGGSMCSRIWEIIPIGGKKWLHAACWGLRPTTRRRTQAGGIPGTELQACPIASDLPQDADHAGMATQLTVFYGLRMCGRLCLTELLYPGSSLSFFFPRRQIFLGFSRV